jgi:integrase
MGIEKKGNKTGISYDAYVYLPQDLQVIYKKKRIHKTFLSLKEAQKWEKDRKKEIDEGFIKINDDITIEDAGKKYMESNKLTLSPNTLRSFIGYIYNYYLPVFNDKPLNKFSCLDLKRFNSFIEKVNKSEKTKHNIATGLRSLLKWAIDNNFLDEELVSYIGKFSQKPVREKDFLNKQELEIMLLYIDDLFLYDIIAFLSFSGLRISELCD